MIIKELRTQNIRVFKGTVPRLLKNHNNEQKIKEPTSQGTGSSGDPPYAHLK
jgi:hypothetical protein